MSQISVSGSSVRIPERAIYQDSHHINMYGRDISELIRSSCLLGSKVPLERVVCKLLITAANAIESLGSLQYQASSLNEFKHTCRTIRSSPLKRIQDDIFEREVDRGIHFSEFAAEVSGALKTIREQYDLNKRSISLALFESVKIKEEELFSLLHFPLNLNKLRKIEKEIKKEINKVLYAIKILEPSEKDEGLRCRQKTGQKNEGNKKLFVLKFFYR